MNEPLNPVELRVLGTLLEKETTTPEYYPMTLNGTTWQLASSPTNTVTLPGSAKFSSSLVGTRLEFNSRGMFITSTSVAQVSLSDSYGQTKSLQVWPSGQVNAL